MRLRLILYLVCKILHDTNIKNSISNFVLASVALTTLPSQRASSNRRSFP